MRNITTHRGILRVLDSLPASRNGNPRYLLSVAGYRCRTEPDSMFAYMVKNLDGKFCEAKIGQHYGKETLVYLEEIPSTDSFPKE